MRRIYATLSDDLFPSKLLLAFKCFKMFRLEMKYFFDWIESPKPTFRPKTNNLICTRVFKIFQSCQNCLIMRGPTMPGAEVKNPV